ncbi:MAG TPA: vitamin K epoxide reductase family protein [Pyrinomonadaceae bacterium]
MSVQREGIVAPKAGAETTSDADRRGTLLYTIAAILSLVGLADAIYLTIEHLAGRSVQCTIVSGCSEVLSSSYATIFGLPLASIGALAYFTVFSCAILAIFGYSSARILLTIVVALMFLATLWLLFVQAFILQAFCAYCLLSAGITLTLTGIIVAAAARHKRAVR